MVPDPTRPQMSVQNELPSELQIQLENAQGEAVQLRREVLRWKMLARQHDERLKEIESSTSWRIFGIIRILPELKNRWKLLLLAGALALLSLPFLPLLAILILFASGRDLIWKALWKIEPLRDLMSFVRQQILSRMSHIGNDETDITPLVYHRPTAVEPSTTGMTNERLCWNLLQQLCPQRRILLQDYGLTRDTLIRDDEIPDLLSLSRTEMSLLRIGAGFYPSSRSGSDGSQ